MSHIALQMVRQHGDRHPGLWARIDALAAKGGWRGTRCHVPLDELFKLALEVARPGDVNGLVADMSAWAALAPWRLSKEIYRFDPALELMLYGQAQDGIPAACLEALPFPCVYVETPNLGPLEEGRPARPHGFFAFFDDEGRGEAPQLVLLFVLKGEGPVGPRDMLPWTIDLGEGALSASNEAITRRLTSGELDTVTGFRSDSDGLRQAMGATASNISGAVARALQLLLYLCARNAEVRESAAHPARRGAVVADHGREIRRWDVGLRVGAAIRAAGQRGEAPTAAGATAPQASRNSPRPHPRRGHWHHFWTGAREGGPGRELVLRWVAPTFVGGPQGDGPAVVHKVKEG